MKLKHILYGNSLIKIREMIVSLQSNSKVKFKGRTYKFEIPNIDILSLSSKDILKLLEINDFKTQKESQARDNT